MISWAALNHRSNIRKRTHAPAKPQVRGGFRVIEKGERQAWAGLRERLRKVMRRMRREENMTPRFEKLRALLTRLERRA